MSTLLRFVRLDVRSLRPSTRAFVLSLAVLLFAAVMPTRSPYAITPALAVFALLFVPQYLFGNDERGRMDTLYGALGIDRTQVVRGRYMTGTIALLLSAVLGVVLTPLVALVLQVDFDWRAVLVLSALTMVLVGIVLSVELPVYFALGAARARSVGIAIPALLVGMVIVIAAVFPPVGEWLLRVFDAVPVPVLVVAALVILVILGAVSLAVASRLYRRRDL